MMKSWKTWALCALFLLVGLFIGHKFTPKSPDVNPKHTADAFRNGWGKGLTAKVTHVGDNRTQEQIRIALFDQFKVDSLKFLATK